MIACMQHFAGDMDRSGCDRREFVSISEATSGTAGFSGQAANILNMLDSKTTS